MQHRHLGVRTNLQLMSKTVCLITGFVSARLRGEYKVTRDDRIDLEFKNLTLNIGPIKAAEKV